MVWFTSGKWLYTKAGWAGASRSSLGVLLEVQVVAMARRLDYQRWLVHQLYPFLSKDLVTVTYVAAHGLMGKNRFRHGTPLLQLLHCLPIVFHAQFRVLVIILYSFRQGYLKDISWQKLFRFLPVDETLCLAIEMSCCITFFYSCSQEDGKEFLYNENTVKESHNIMDKWILSFTQSLIQFFKTEMAGEYISSKLGSKLGYCWCF